MSKVGESEGWVCHMEREIQGSSRPREEERKEEKRQEFCALGTYLGPAGRR